jgi:hypothetical protein
MATTVATQPTTQAAQPSKAAQRIAAARAMAKGITAAAVAAQPMQATRPAPKAASATVVATTQAAQVVNTAYYQTVVTSVGAPKVGKPGTFFGNLHNMAQQPITLQALIALAVAGNKFTSKKSHAFVATVRTRHAFTRLGYLVAVPTQVANG